jgi:biopolymer transport protein ExbD
MAGGGEAEDNPVNINVVPMVDVIFCLCVFFMCSFKFKQLEGRFQSWLPKDLGNGQVTPDQPIEMRVAMYWDEQKGEVVRQYGNRFVKEDDELESLINGAHKDFVAQNHPNAPVIVDADAKVPWGAVMNVVNIAKKLQIESIQFALGANAPSTH